MEIVVACHCPLMREVSSHVHRQGLVSVNRLSQEGAHRAKCSIFALSSSNRPPRTSRLLSCHRSVGRLPHPCPIDTAATSCEFVRSTRTPIIAASDGTISAQKECQLASHLLPGEQLTWVLTVVCLQKSRRSCCRPRQMRVAMLWPETMHSTIRACAPRPHACSPTDRRWAGRRASPPQDRKTQ